MRAVGDPCWHGNVDISQSLTAAAQSCLTLYNPTDCSAAGLPVHHQYTERAQTHVHPVTDAIQPSHPLSSPSHPASNLSQHQGLFQWVSSSHKVVKVLEFQLQHQSFHEFLGLVSSRIDWFDLLAVQGMLKSSTPHFKSINSSVLSFLYSPTITSIHDHWKNHSLD